MPSFRAALLTLACFATVACGGSPTSPSSSGSSGGSSSGSQSRTVTGQVLDALRGSGVSGATVQITTVGNATTNTDGSFSTTCANCASGNYAATVSAVGYVERNTKVQVPGSSAAVTMMPTSFNATAFNELARTFASNGGLTRWTAAPALVFETSMLNDIDSTTALSAQMSDSDIAAIQSALTANLPTLTGGVFTSFSSISRTTTAAGQTVDLSRNNAIVVVMYQNRFAGLCGQGGPIFDSASLVVSRGRIWLDRSWATCNPTTAIHELGHALGYNHVTATTSIMNVVSPASILQFDRDAATIAYRRPPGNRAPDADPDSFIVNQSLGGGRLISPVLP